MKEYNEEQIKKMLDRIHIKRDIALVLSTRRHCKGCLNNDPEVCRWCGCK